jgi:primary-amine oxidase
MGSLEGASIPHPFDPLSLEEIQTAISTVKKAHGDVTFNVVSLHEPRKAEMQAWLEKPDSAPRPARIADIVVIAPGSKVYDGLVDIKESKILKWEHMEGVQPIVRLQCHSLQLREHGDILTTPGDRSQWKNSWR